MRSDFVQVLQDLARADVQLRRAWPRAADHLLLDVDDLVGGEQTAGQWFAEESAAVRAAAATPGASRRGRVVLQPRGADRRLSGLAALVETPGNRLVAHRPERRAVVAVAGGARFAKLVPARRLRAVRRTCQQANLLPLRTPQLDPYDDGSTVTTLALAGAPLTTLLGDTDVGPALTAVGAALASLHRCAPPAGAAIHGPTDEVAVTRRWEHWAEVFALPVSAPAGDPSGLPPAPAAAPRLIHRDLHDGQLMLERDANGHYADNGVGLLDFDLMAAGDPALDLANLLEHLALRARQRVLPDADPAVEALLAGYQPSQDVLTRVSAYRALAARRLEVVYAFRAANLVT